ncbi:MAG: preprotein translocase subunit SecE [Candidatus Krumholzibacteriia bacterium]
MLAKLRAYVLDTVAEMKRVSWPTFAELKESTWVVIVTVAVITLFIFLVDKTLNLTIKKLITLT